MFIEGENLEVLKVLQKAYYGKIKMIYIDPPYNTGNDNFIYPDRFYESKEEYLKRVNEKDEAGYLLKEGLFRKNSKENGQFHSNWLSMIYSRLFLARNLLRDDGVIFVSIDDNEVHNLRLLMNEIFGEENFINQLIISRNTAEQTEYRQSLNEEKEYVLVYSKTNDFDFEESTIPFDKRAVQLVEELKKRNFGNKYIELIEELADMRSGKSEWKSLYTGKESRPSMQFKILGVVPFDQKNLNRRWMWGEQRALKAVKNYEEFLKKYPKGSNEELIKYSADTGIKDFVKKSETGTIQYFKHAKDGRVIGDNWIDIRTSSGANNIRTVFDRKIFDNPKPTDLIKRIMSIVCSANDIVLDFFAGSGTTAHAVLDLNKEDGGNRKFICVQLPEKCADDSEAYKAGYKTIADIAKERIRRVIKKLRLNGHSRENGNPDELFEHKELDLGFKVFKLTPSNFKLWRSDVIENSEDLEKQLDTFKNPVKPEVEHLNMMYEILLKSGYSLTTKIEEKKISGCLIYSVADGEMIIALSKITETLIKEIIKLKPKKCICLDGLFSGNDQLKTNTVLQMKDAGIEFKTI